MNQTAGLLALLRERPEGITPLDALDELGRFRLAARVWDLRAEGYTITMDMDTMRSGKRVARYRIVEPDETQVAMFFGGES